LIYIIFSHKNYIFHRKSLISFYQFKAKVYFCMQFSEKMTHNYEELIKGFELRLRTLISGYRSLQEKNAILVSELERRQNDLMLAHREILELRQNYDHLRMARTLAATDEEKAESKKRIEKMVREIDKCLALLDE